MPPVCESTGVQKPECGCAKCCQELREKYGRPQPPEYVKANGVIASDAGPFAKPEP